VFAGTEETSTGVTRLRAMAADKDAASIPVIAINDADTKHLFDNRYGTGQSTMDGVLRATNMLVAAPRWSSPATAGAVAGSRRARRAWAPRSRDRDRPVRALEAADGRLHGHEHGERRAARRPVHHGHGQQVGAAPRALPRHEGGRDHRQLGHFNVEIDIPALERLSVSRKVARAYVEEFRLKGGKRLFLLGEGRLINLARRRPPGDGDGHVVRQPGAGVEHLVKKARSCRTMSTWCRRPSTRKWRG
jgi:adenosylhomocysteinase